ncbi:ciliary microtubule inner protein 1 isoform X1 [Callorhinus ursinus]|uniref:ciliary microtubule inner protein 1 isoform X1 n=1 Tax=Callorhinus ursinus TaxID=34884 RepID=UPI003CCFF78B
MAEKPLSTAAAERMNLVAQDEIWKYRLKAETEARQNWAQNWGFLTTPLEEIPNAYMGFSGMVATRLQPFKPPPGQDTQKPHFFGRMQNHLLKGEEKPPTPKPKIELPERFHIRPVTPVEKYIKILPSPPIPKTTQGFIGWRSGVPGLNKCLEHDYEIRSCKGAYANELGWPKQGIH